MTKLYFTPGPSQLYHTVPQHIKNGLRENIGSISHRSPTFQAIFEETRNLLAEVLRLPKGYEILFTSSATEVWERILQSLVDQHAHFFVNGSFSNRFYEFGTQLVNATKTESEPGHDFTQLDIPAGSELIGLAMNETSTGFTFDIEKLKRIRSENSEKLIALDVVSSVPAVDIDLSLVDTAYFSVQKCFGLPAGLGVWIVGPEAISKAETLEASGHPGGTYHSLLALRKAAEKNQTPETPNVLFLYLLGKVCQDMLDRGIKNIRNETIYKSTILYQVFEQLDFLTPFVKDPTNRSRTVCVAEIDNGSDELRRFLAEKGLIIGAGYGPFKQKHIRIANFPTHSKEQVEMLVDYLDNFAGGQEL